jgi:phosphoribosylaminoimidazole carboxylase (NCAIR synthetase)
MANVFGAEDLAGPDPDVYDRYIHVMAGDPGVKVHMYGKAVRPGRKIGHVTVAGTDVAALRDRATRAASYLSTGKEQSE